MLTISIRRIFENDFGYQEFTNQFLRLHRCDLPESGRPIFNPARTAASAESSGNESESPENAELTAIEKEDEKRDAKMKSFTTSEKAPRDERGELILKRREVHSGRAMTVSTVEWSVAELYEP